VKADPAFLLELGALLVLLGAAGAIALRIGLSAVPLFLIAGLLVGEGGVLPAPSAGPFLSLAAGLGMVLLLLVLGLEFSSAEFTDALRRHAPSGAVDFVLNAGPGALAGVLLGLPLAGILALAGITWISSSGIVARTISDLGRLGYRETPSVLSVLVLEDIAMALFLPVLGVALAGGDLGAAVGGVTIALSAVVVALVLSRRASAPLERLLSHDSDEQVMLRVLGLTLIVAGAAELAGVSAAVGAFLVGLAIPGDTARAARRVLSPLRDLFGAAFFLSFAYSTDPTDLVPVLLPAVGLAIVTAGTKVATGWYAAARDGVGTRGRVRAGLSLVARGEFSIVIAGLAVGAGILEIGPLATAYVLILAIAGPVLARLAGQRRDTVRSAVHA
jgi:CPA2 family monovalent cation:H+ antiporter-2